MDISSFRLIRFTGHCPIQVKYNYAIGKRGKKSRSESLYFYAQASSLISCFFLLISYFFHNYLLFDRRGLSSVRIRRDRHARGCRKLCICIYVRRKTKERNKRIQYQKECCDGNAMRNIEHVIIDDIARAHLYHLFPICHPTHPIYSN